jgi:hypothetical protein
MHAAFAFWLVAAFEVPTVDISFEMPMDVELGMSDEVAMAAASSAAAPEPTQPAPAAPKAADSTGPESKPREKNKEAADAGAPKAEPESKPRDAGPTAPSDALDQGSKLPAGAQIAVRVDMARIRSSPIADDVRTLLSAIPDWQALLAGSGIDPIEQLDRLLIATPNLQREKVVIAGRYVGTREVVDAAVSSLAAARSVEASWRSHNGVESAPWANADDVERVIALVGPQHFTITRPEDLARVLAIAAARKRADDTALPADALLSMEEGEGLSLEVEGVEQFVKRGKRGIPQRLRVSASERPGPSVRIDARLDFETSEKAADGLRFWDDLRSRYARNALVMMLGLASPLANASLEIQESQLRASIELTVGQTRLILGYVRELLTPPAPPTPLAPMAPTGLPSAGTPSPP